MKPQQVSLSKDSKKEIVDALRDIRKAIQEDDRKQQTFSENIADSLTSGSSFIQSIREAVRTESSKESAKIRKALDPLEIVKKMTGGSKLATALAGKAIGRSNENIRKSLGFSVQAPVSPEPAPSVGTPPLASSVGSGEAIPLLEQIAKSVAITALRVTDIADKLKASKKVSLDENGRLRDKVSGKFMSASQAKEVTRQSELLQSIRDSLLGIRKDDAAREDRKTDAERAAHAHDLRKPTVQVNAKGQEIVKPIPPQKEEGGVFQGLLGSFANAALTVTGFAAAVAAILHPIEAFKTGLALVNKGIEAVKSTFEFFTKGKETVKAVGHVGEGLVGALKTTEDVVKGEGVVSKTIAAGSRIGQKIFAKKPSEVHVPTKEVTKLAGQEVEGTAKALTKGTEHVAEAGVKAATELPKPVAKEAAKVATKPTVAKAGKEQINKILSKRLPKAFGGATVGKLIPGIGAAIGLGFAVSRLVKGDVMGAVLEGISGFGGAATAVPAIVAQLVRDVYEEYYHKFPEQDPLVAQRLPELTEIVKNRAANWLSGKNKGKEEMTPSSNENGSQIPEIGTPNVTAIPPPAPTTGTTLAQAAVAQEDLTAAPTVTAPAPSAVSIQNVTNNQSSAILAPGIPASRSQDSSYLRAVDHNVPE